MISDMSKRFRDYEKAFDVVLPRRMPVLIRIDGRSFHTYARRFEKPFSDEMRELMDRAAVAVCEEAQGAQCAYVQSDEITVLLVNYSRFSTEPWFGNRVQKICSVAASIATEAFNRGGGTANFDARCYVLPREEVNNAFVERQRDAIRNAILSVAQHAYGHKAIHGKSCAELEQMLSSDGLGLGTLRGWQLYGRLVEKYPSGECAFEWTSKPALRFDEFPEQINARVWPRGEEGAKPLTSASLW